MIKYRKKVLSVCFFILFLCSLGLYFNQELDLLCLSNTSDIINSIDGSYLKDLHAIHQHGDLKIHRALNIREIGHYDEEKGIVKNFTTMKVTPLSKFSYSLVAQGALRDLRKYPKSFFELGIIKHIALVHNIQDNLTDGLSAYGTAVGINDNQGIIILSSRIYAPQGGRVLHHEIAGLVFSSQHFQKYRSLWEAALPKGFRYLKNDVLAIHKDVNAHHPSSHYWELGFMEAYSLSQMEDDFSTMVEWYMDDYKGLSDLAKQYPLIKAKFEIIEELYETLFDPNYKPTVFYNFQDQ